MLYTRVVRGDSQSSHRVLVVQSGKTLRLGKPELGVDSDCGGFLKYLSALPTRVPEVAGKRVIGFLFSTKRG
jgi:hypothetical protein